MEKKMPKLIVSGIAYNDGKVLLIQRGKRPFEGSWSTVGGKVEYGEDLEEALRREFKEEVGVDISNIKFFRNYNFIGEDGDKQLHFLTVLYTCQIIGDIQPLQEEVKDFKWVTLEEAKELGLAFDVEKRLKDFFERNSP
jgi:ADP-ribose pyrophosphatase YjhB (NUDIX family)